jgi:hypothetical protein
VLLLRLLFWADVESSVCLPVGWQVAFCGGCGLATLPLLTAQSRTHVTRLIGKSVATGEVRQIVCQSHLSLAAKPSSYRFAATSGSPTTRARGDGHPYSVTRETKPHELRCVHRRRISKTSANPVYLARLGNLWVDSGVLEGPIEVSAEFAAGGLKGSLLFF